MHTVGADVAKAGLAWPASHRLTRAHQQSLVAELSACVSTSADPSTG